MKLMIGIYKITNIKNNKVYIGQSVNIEKRWREHIYAFRRGDHTNVYFQRAWNKYGEENFIFEIIEECLIENLNDKESFYILKFQATNPQYGYNRTFGGESPKMTPEYKEYISKLSHFNNSKLTKEQVIKIKMCLYLGMDRKEIMKRLNVNRWAITNIVTLNCFEYVLPEINDSIKNMDNDYNEYRTNLILEEYNKGFSVSEIVKNIGFSSGIVERTLYKYTDSTIEKLEQRKKNYNNVSSLKKQGKSKSEISKILSIPYSTVAHYYNDESNPNIPLSYKKIREEEKPLIYTRIAQGEKVSDLAFEYNVQPVTIWLIKKSLKYANTEVTKEIKESLAP